MSIKGHQNVAYHDAVTLGWTVLVHFDNQQPGFLRATSALRNRQMNKLATNSKIAALDVALFCQCLGDIFCDSDWNSQGNAIHQAGGQHPDHCSLRIDQRTARKAWIGDGISTNVAFEGHTTSCA